MKKLLHTLLIFSLLISTALANVTVYRCLSGDFCLTKTCCSEVEQVNTCCSEHTRNVIVNEECCDEFDIITDTVFKDAGDRKSKLLDFSQAFDNFISHSLISKSTVYKDIIRGPPSERSLRPKYNSPIYLSNSSFLC